MLLAVLKKGRFPSCPKGRFPEYGRWLVAEPAAEVVVAAVLSSNFDFLPNDVASQAKSGPWEIRPVSAARRLSEAARLGFKKIYVSSYEKLPDPQAGISIIPLSDIPDLVKKLFK